MRLKKCRSALKTGKAQRSKLAMLPLEAMEISPVRTLFTSLMYADDRPPRISSLTCKDGNDCFIEATRLGQFFNLKKKKIASAARTASRMLVEAGRP